MNAELTIKVRINNVCNKEDLEETKRTFKEEVQWLIKEESLYEVMTWGEEPRLIEIKEVK